MYATMPYCTVVSPGSNVRNTQESACDCSNSIAFRPPKSFKFPFPPLVRVARSAASQQLSSPVGPLLLLIRVLKMGPLICGVWLVATASLLVASVTLHPPRANPVAAVTVFFPTVPRYLSTYLALCRCAAAACCSPTRAVPRPPQDAHCPAGCPTGFSLLYLACPSLAFILTPLTWSG